MSKRSASVDRREQPNRIVIRDKNVCGFQNMVVDDCQMNLGSGDAKSCKDIRETGRVGELHLDPVTAVRGEEGEIAPQV